MELAALIWPFSFLQRAKKKRKRKRQYLAILSRKLVLKQNEALHTYNFKREIYQAIMASLNELLSIFLMRNLFWGGRSEATSASTIIESSSLKSPFKTPIAISFSTNCCITRLTGRAPKFGSKPSFPKRSVASLV